MPSVPKSEAEWKALDHRIAQEVMGWSSSQGFWCDGNTNLYLDGAHFFAKLELWQPHNNVAQAMGILDKMSVRRKGTVHNWFYRIQSYPQISGHLYNVYLRTCIFPTKSQAPVVLDYSADAYILTHAICLAIEKWIDTQGLRMPDWAAS